MSAAQAPNVAVSSHLTIVVGLDFSASDAEAFEQAAHMAERLPGSHLHLVHVFGHEPDAERARDLMGHLRLYVNEKSASMSLGGTTIGVHLRAGDVPQQLAQLASEVAADLIVVGVHPGLHLKRWIGASTVEKLVQSTGCPVLVARPHAHAQTPHVIAIEAACPECLRARAESRGGTWWCARHTGRSAGGHTYSYQRELPFTFHDSEVIPTGTDL